MLALRDGRAGAWAGGCGGYLVGVWVDWERRGRCVMDAAVEEESEVWEEAREMGRDVCGDEYLRSPPP